MRKNVCFALSIALAVLFSGYSYAQDARVTSAVGDIYVISAKAGGVSVVEGKVALSRKAGKNGLLLKNDQLEAGDRVTTGPDSKAEVLLNPGSYLRIGSNTSFEFENTSLEDLRVKFHSGSAVIEVLASDDFAINVAVSGTSFKLNRSGVFRIDVTGDGGARVAVWKGRMTVNGDDVKSGRVAIISGSNAAVAKFDRDGGDDLDVWSKFRAKEVAAINGRLERNAMRSSLLNAYNNGRWNAYNSFGLWVFDPIRRMWCFLPFGGGWGSPYGYGYSFNMWYCRMPYWVYTPPVVPPSGGGGVTPTQPDPRVVRSQTPPFQRTNPDGSPGGGINRVPPTSTSGDSTRDRGGRLPRNNDESPRYDKTPRYETTKPISTPEPSTPIIVPPSSTRGKSDKDN